MSILKITTLVQRRFILGKQGLWPGRRWQGKNGAAQATRQMGALQIDPMVVVARSHDLKLHSRVLDYSPAHLDTLLYTDRQFFDYGGWLAVFPMEELPYWRLHMKRHLGEAQWDKFANENVQVIDMVRAELRSRGPLGHRDFKGARIESDQARNVAQMSYGVVKKDTGLALYYLWRIGELMTSSRRGFDRLYDFTENVAPEIYRTRIVSDDDAEWYFEHKVLSIENIATLSGWRTSVNYYVRRTIPLPEAKEKLAAHVTSGEFSPVQVEGNKVTQYVLSEDIPLIEELLAGKTPEQWQPIATTTEQEVVFLAPLDPVSARGRATKLFDFEYIWEVYKPAHLRRWGYYVLPILYGNDLVARIDPKLDRTTKTMRLKGFWLDQPELAKDKQFAAALARGLQRFTRFHQATALDSSVVDNPFFQREIQMLKI